MDVYNCGISHDYSVHELHGYIYFILKQNAGFLFIFQGYKYLLYFALDSRAEYGFLRVNNDSMLCTPAPLSTNAYHYMSVNYVKDRGAPNIITSGLFGRTINAHIKANNNAP